MILLMIVLTGFGWAHAQTIFEELKGEFKVGFKLLEKWDSTRIYGDGFRPMQIAVWYPSHEAPKSRLTLEDMIRMGARSETLSKDGKQEEGEIKGYINSAHINSDKAIEYLSADLGISNQIEIAKGKYPVVLYAPGSSAHWYDNYLMCQILASHGYIVASMKSRSHQSPTMSMNWIGVNSQVQDLEFALSQVYGLIGSENITGVNVTGRSWGAIAALVFAIKNERITKTIASLDGTLSYNAHLLLEESDYSNADYVRKPLFLAVGKKRSENATPIDRKRYFEDVTFADAYQAEYEHMPHTAFGSYYLYYHYLLNKGIDDTTSDQLQSGFKKYSQHLLTFLDFYNDYSKNLLKETTNDECSIQFQELVTPPLPDYQDFGYVREVKGAKAAAYLYNQTKAIDSVYAKNELFSAGFMNASAYQYLSKGDIESAITLLKIAIDAFPDNSNLYDSFGEMLFNSKKLEKSLKAYEESLRLNEGNENAKMMIEKIKRQLPE